MIQRFFLTVVFTLLAAVAVSTGVPAALAQSRPTAAGTWYFNVSINGAPPCQCIQIASFYADGHIDGPGTDWFSGDIRGEWAVGADGKIVFTLIENNYNPDGSAGGMYIIKGAFASTTADSGSGVSTFQIVDNTGKVMVSGSATFKATKIHAQ